MTPAPGKPMASTGLQQCPVALATHTNTQTYVCTHKINISLYKFNNYAYSHPVKEIDAEKDEGMQLRLYYCMGQKLES